MEEGEEEPMDDILIVEGDGTDMQSEDHSPEIRKQKQPQSNLDITNNSTLNSTSQRNKY